MAVALAASLPLAADEVGGFYSGVYLGADAPRGLTLELVDDHTVKLTEIIIGRNSVSKMSGTWSQTGDQVNVQLRDPAVVCNLRVLNLMLIRRNVKSDCPLAPRMFNSELPK